MQRLSNNNLQQWQDAHKKMGTLLHGLQDVVQIVTDRKDVSIQLGTSTCTDGKHIYIEPPPEVFQGKAVTEAVKARVYHEAAHILYTQFVDKNGEQLLEKARKANGCNFQTMVNAIEDARVEANLFQDFPGTEKHLHGHLDMIARTVDFKGRDEDQQVIAGTYLVGANYNVAGLFTARVEKTLNEYVDLIHEVGGCKTTQDIYDLAERVYQMFQDEGYFAEADVTERPGPEGTPGSGGDDDDGTGEDENGTEDEDEDGEYDPEEGQQGTGDDDDAEEDEDEGDEGEDILPTHAEMLEDVAVYDEMMDEEDADENQGEVGTTLLEEIQISRTKDVTDVHAIRESQEIQKAFNGRVIGIKGGTITGLVEDKAEEAFPSQKHDAQGVMNAGAGVTGFLTTHLRAVFKDNAKTRFEGQYRSGRKINKRDLHKIATQTSDKVFARRNKPGKADYAVMLGVDCSGSMHTEHMGVERVRRAAEATLLLTKVLNNLGITSKVVGFSTQDAVVGYGEDAWHIIYKDWKENGSLDVLGRMMTMESRNYNLDGYFLQEAYKELRTRKETKRILIVLSDSTPYEDAANQTRLMGEYIGKMQKEGIEVIGIGIATDSVKAFYPNNIVVWDEEELGQKVLKALHEALLR